MAQNINSILVRKSRQHGFSSFVTRCDNAMESIHQFLEEVTEELLYNIVYDHDEIDYRELSKIFEEENGYQPMDFFGFGNETGQGWLNFIKGIPGV